MCSSDKVVTRQQPKLRAPISREARRSNRSRQSPDQARPRSSSQDRASTQANAKEVREAFIAAFPAARMRGSKPLSTKVPSTSRPTLTRGTGGQGHHELTKPFLKLVDIVEEMEANIVGLQTSNTRQAKELADLRSKNERLEQDHAQLEKTLDGFSTSIVAHLELASKAIAQCHGMATKTDNRLEDYMDSLERMADRMGSKFHNLNFRTSKVQEAVKAVDEKSTAKLDELAAALEELQSIQRETSISPPVVPLHLNHTTVSAPAAEISAPFDLPKTSIVLDNEHEGNEGARMDSFRPSATVSNVPNAAAGELDDFDDARRRSPKVGEAANGCPASTIKKLHQLPDSAAINNYATLQAPPAILRRSPLSFYNDINTASCMKGMECRHGVEVAEMTTGD